MKEKLLTDKGWRHETTKTVLADLGRIREAMSPFLGRLRARLRSEQGSWRPEILITLTGEIDASVRGLRPIRNDIIVRRLRQYYEELAEYDRSSHQLNALPIERIGRRDLQQYHLLFTRKHRETMFLHDILRTGHNTLEPVDGVEAESLAINELWDFEHDNTPNPNFDYPPTPRVEDLRFH